MTARPKTFESVLLMLLIAFWVVSALCNESVLGRKLLGYKSELYPMSTFSVYLHPKLSKTRVYSFEVLEKANSKPVELNAYRMFYPLQAPDLDDEIATTFPMPGVSYPLLSSPKQTFSPLKKTSFCALNIRDISSFRG